MVYTLANDYQAIIHKILECQITYNCNIVLLKLNETAITEQISETNYHNCYL